MTTLRIAYDTSDWPFDLPADPPVADASAIALPPPTATGTGWTIDGLIANSETVGATGATAMGVPAATSAYQVNGTGIRIGILSNSFNLLGGEQADIAAGLLPADGVTILQEGPAGSDDEGRAMAELIHAIAPGAQIDFYSGSISEAGLAAGIIALAQQGCSVIVDDLTYYDEPFFQDGSAVQTAVEDVTAEGVSYFTSASNAGDNFFQASFNPTVAVLPGGDGPVAANRFANGTPLQSLTITGGDNVIIDLQWAQPFANIGTGDGAADSLALYLYDSAGNLVGSSAANETGGNPDQYISFTNSGTTANYNLAIVWNGGSVQPGLFKYIVYSGDAGAITINDPQAGIGSGSVSGHELIPQANTVGAVNAADTPANGVSPPQLESYSSVGPGEILYDANGNLLPTPVDTGKVDFTAPDGIATSVFDPFYGTSAAAPDAAAVAALMLQANPNLSAAQITGDLEATALPMAGSAAADGAGLVQAPGAVQSAFGVAWRAASGGAWATALGWAGGNAPSAAQPATLSNDYGTLDSSYSVSITTKGAAADTLTVGDAASLNVTLHIDPGLALAVTTGATVGQHGTLTVGGSGTLAVGGIAELIDPTAVLALQPTGVLTAQAIELGGGTLTLAAAAAAVATGSVDLVLTFGTVDQPVPFGFLMGAGTVNVGLGAVVATETEGGMFLGGGGLTIDPGGTLVDLDPSGVSMIVLDASLADLGRLDTTGELLVNIGADVAVAANAMLTAEAIDVEGDGALFTIAGSVTDATALTGAPSGTVDIVAGGTFAIAGAMGGANIDLASGARLVLSSLDAATLAGGFTSAIAVSGSGIAEIDLPGIAYDHGANRLHFIAGVLDIAAGNTTLAELFFPSGSQPQFTQSNDGAGGLLLGVACYCRGTNIATPKGEAPIETLRIGDAVLTAAGVARPIRWIGRRSYGRGHVSTHRHLQPIRIRAGALGADAGGPVPRRDLRVSPEHAVRLDDPARGPVLLPAHLLVNGKSILREAERAGVDYLHIELEQHDVILAEGAAAETFIDVNSRALFDNAAEFTALHPNEAARPPRYCAPRIEGGPVVVRVMRRLYRIAGIAHGSLGGPMGGPAGGHLDRADREMVAGWAHDHANPDCPVLLEIVVDGAVVGTTVADRYRADMAALKHAGGHCAFRFQFAKPLDAGRRHIISVRRAADGADLRASPLLLDRIPPPEALLNELRSASPALRREIAAWLGEEIERLRQRSHSR